MDRTDSIAACLRQTLSTACVRSCADPSPGPTYSGRPEGLFLVRQINTPIRNLTNVNHDRGYLEAAVHPRLKSKLSDSR